MLLTCPRDHQILERKRVNNTVHYRCPFCQGAAVTMGLLRRRLDREFTNDLWNRARTSSRDGVPCPACLGESKTVVVFEDDEDQGTEIDVCRRCQILWLDPGELENAPGKKPPRALPDTTELLTETKQELAIIEVRAEEQRRKEKSRRLLQRSDDPGRDFFKAILLWGLPVEEEQASWLDTPWVTWSVMLLMALISGVALLTLSSEELFGRAAVPPILPKLVGLFEVWGFVPAEWSRSGGVTIISSFFLHAGWIHLLGNLYFLWLTGDDVENELGKGRFLLLLVGATVTATLLRYLSDPSSTVPGIGASGGISGVMAYYALAYPRRRLKMFFFYWRRVYVLTVRARALFILWVLYQLFLAYREVNGEGLVSGTAHLGGVVGGVMAWLMWRHLYQPQASEEATD